NVMMKRVYDRLKGANLVRKENELKKVIKFIVQHGTARNFSEEDELMAKAALIKCDDGKICNKEGIIFSEKEVEMALEHARMMKDEKYRKSKEEQVQKA